MSDDLKNPWYTGMKTRTALLIGLVAAVLVLVLAWYVCSLRYDSVKRDILAERSASMESWVSGTVNAVDIWTDNQESLVRRVSDAENFRMFLSDANLLDQNALQTINDSDSGVAVPEDVQFLTMQVPYFRNLMLDFQDMNGFLDTRVVTPQGLTLLATVARPAPLTAEQSAAMDKAFSTNKISYGAVRGSSSGLVLDIAAPMLPTIASGGGDQPIAATLVTTQVTGLIAQLHSRDMRSSSIKPHILQQNNGIWQEIRPDDSMPTPLNAEQVASLNPTETGKLEFTLRPGLENDAEAYSLGTLVPDVGWFVILEVPASEVAKELRGQGLMIYGIGFLISLGVMLGLALAWWTLYGRQQRVIAQRFERLYRVIDQQKSLLDSVNMSLDVGLFMSDTNGNILTGNRAFADIAGTTEDRLESSTLSSLLDAKTAGEMLDNVRVVATSDIPKSVEISLEQSDGPHLYRLDLYPFEDKVKADGHHDDTKGAVATMQDITEFRRNSEKRRLQQIHTIDAFIKAIEGVDPYLAGHSNKMSRLADLVAQQMDLPDADRNTVTLAANLSQVGKLFVPRDLLHKTGKLSEEEHAEMNKVPEHAYRVLKDIDFELPVPEAIYQMNEKLDGTGFPQHLQNSDISLHARILSVLNAFTAMVSPRSYRDGMGPDQAIAQLRQTPTIYDQKVVDALAEVIKTPAGIQAFAVNPE